MPETQSVVLADFDLGFLVVVLLLIAAGGPLWSGIASGYKNARSRRAGESKERIAYRKSRRLALPPPPDTRPRSDGVKERSTKGQRKSRWVS